jgi:uncharacterized Ntn-hydrolase superfamily protein
MRRLIFALLLLVVAQPAYATWSIIAIDQRTGTMIIASATCVTSSGLAKRGGLKSIQAIVVPGIGIAAAQAAVDSSRANQMLIYQELQKGTAPGDILALLKQDPAIESRQFGILDLQGRMAGFSGSRNGATSLDSQGQVAGTTIFYSIQGNILARPEVVHEAVKAFTSAAGTLADRVMAGMEAADRQGGDRRCTCDTPPAVQAPCDAKTAHVAYVLQAEKGDKPGQSHSDGEYSMFIDVTDANITPTENANPVKTLRMRYDAWKKSKTGK